MEHLTSDFDGLYKMHAALKTEVIGLHKKWDMHARDLKRCIKEMAESLVMAASLKDL